MADFEFETTGLVNVTNGSVDVAGVGTNWVASYPGLMLWLDGLSYPVKSVNSRNSITLVHPYQGSTATGAEYALVPVHPGTLSAQKAVITVLEAINNLMENGGIGGGGSGSGGSGITGAVVNSAGHLIITLSDGRTIDAGLVKGADGQDGQDGTGSGGGDISMAAIQGFSQFAGTPVGGGLAGLFIPVTTGAPNITLTQRSEIVIPWDDKDAGAAMWVEKRSAGAAIIVGAANVPLPQPGGNEDIDLSGSSTFYAEFNKVTPLGITLVGSPSSLSLSRAFTDSQLKIMRKQDRDIYVAKSATWYTGASGSPYPVSGDLLGPAFTLSKKGPGTSSYANGKITLNKDAYLKTNALGLEFRSSSDAQTSQTPGSAKLTFKGTAPAGTGLGVQIGTYEAYGNEGGIIAHQIHWDQERIQFTYGRSGSNMSVNSDPGFALTGAEHLFETVWVNNETGPGGTVTFYVDGVQYGAAKATELKPRAVPGADFQINASVENTSNSVNGLVVEYAALELGMPGVETTYHAVTDGPISVDHLQNLVVDATGVTSQQPERVLSYTANGNQQFDLTIVVGEMVLPAGRPHSARLEDWSSGSAVPVGTLTMTRPAAQNCRFEDAVFFGAQGSWTEVMPQETPPALDGIRYGIEGIRQGNYTMFQFLYWLDQPAAPFGDPTGLETYMRPHKWVVLDSDGNALWTVQKPNGEPLNATSTPAVWNNDAASNMYDGRSIPYISANKRWYPHGTARSSIIYRNGKPPAYDQQFILDHLPVFDQRVPFASHTGFSVNGFNLNLYAGSAGGDGQSNGFANWNCMPWKPFEETYESIKLWSTTTLSPYKNLFNEAALTPNAGIFLKYEPWNTMGRCPVVGPGGTRDDRQIIPEPVARYMRDVNAVRAHDNLPLADIALDYMTGYASDPYNAVNGTTMKLTPLYRNAPRRNITMRNHYYGPGEATTPADQAWYAQVGRLSEWTSNRNPLRANVPGSAKTPDKPYFGGNEIDNLHAHQFPHWGSGLWQTPEFAMFGVNFTDQSRLYGNSILESMWGPTSFASRESAWPFMHATLIWKFGSSNSTRLYSRAEVLDWVVFDFEKFYDQWYDNGSACFLNPPTNILGSDGKVNGNLACLAGAAIFGNCYGSDGLELSEFQAGYWLSALHAAHKLGFLDALRNVSPKCAQIIDWLIAMHRKRVTNRINEGLLLNNAGSDYQVRYWTTAQIIAAGGDVSKLPQTMAQVIAADPLKSPSWHQYRYINDGGQTVIGDRDGQAMDANLAAAALLLDMNLVGDTAPLVQAATKAEQLFQEKLQSELAKPAAQRGAAWFKYHQTTNNRPYKP